MIADADIAAVGALIGDRTRAAMLNALMGGEPMSAGELARVGGVSPSGATAHLRRLREGGLVVDEAAGRQRVFRLAGPELAELPPVGGDHRVDAHLSSVDGDGDEAVDPALERYRARHAPAARAVTARRRRPAP